MSLRTLGETCFMQLSEGCLFMSNIFSNGAIYSTSSPGCHFPGPFSEDFNGTEEPDCAESAKPEWCSDKWCCLVKGVGTQISDQFPSKKVMFERPSERSKTVFTTP